MSSFKNKLQTFLFFFLKKVFYNFFTIFYLIFIFLNIVKIFFTDILIKHLALYKYVIIIIITIIIVIIINNNNNYNNNNNFFAAVIENIKRLRFIFNFSEIFTFKTSEHCVKTWLKMFTSNSAFCV